MGFREIDEQDGRTWRVWDTAPHRSAGRGLISDEYASGWLTFECETEKRRLAPIPEGWESLAPAGLLRLMREAAAVTPRPAAAEAAHGPPRAPA